MKPITEGARPGAWSPGRMTIDRIFHGDLAGTSQGEMMAAMTELRGPAGYVAVEKVSGVLAGRHGTFLLQHRGLMARGVPELEVVVVPDSGTGVRREPSEARRGIGARIDFPEHRLDRALLGTDAVNHSDSVSLRAGVVEDGWLPRTASAMAHQVQQVTSREAEESARRLGRLPYSRSSFERVAHAVGDLYVPAHGDIEDALIEEYEIPRKARSVSVSLDRVSVPMEEPLPRPVGRPKKDAPKRPVARNFRMAYCATVTLHDRDGNGLHTIRYGRMPQGDARNLCEGLGADVAALLAKRPGLKVATLCDGAAELWNLLAEPLSEEALGTEVHKVVDLWHLLEKLGRAAAVIHGSSAADEVVQRWRLRLLNSSRAAEAILAS